MNMVHTDKAPAAIGPYSQAVIHNGLVFTSGQIALVPETMAIAEGGVREQTEQVLKNLGAVLEKAGSSKNNVLKTTIFLKNMGDFAVVNEVYADFFQGHKPARSTVEVARLPKDVLIEIEMIATLS